MLGHDPAELAAVETAEARFAAEQERGCIRLHRLRLQATVVATSPLTRDLVARAGADIDEAVQGLRPSPERIPARSYLHRFHHQLIPGGKGMPAPAAAPVRDSDRRLSRRISREGVMIAGRPGSRDRLGIVPLAGVLECAGWLGPCWFCTEGPLAHVLVDVPETIVAVSPGRMIGELVDHPAFLGRDYPVRRATVLATGGVALSFRTGLIAYRMPWADELASEMERSS